MKISKPSITIIGAGAVGSAWLDFFKHGGYPLRSVWRSETGYLADEDYNIHRELNRPLPVSDEEIGDWIFITTPDDSIKPAVKLLSETEIDWSGKIVIHCSGNMPASVLNPLGNKGAKTASMHPIQTFQKGDGKEKLETIYISLQGNSSAIDLLKNVVDQLKSKPLILTENQKKAVHISAVFASNYLVALLNSSDQLLKENGIEEGVNILEPLIHQTLHNILEKGPEKSLTGPISRGDYNTVNEHLNFLADKNDDELSLYRLLGKTCLSLTRKQGRLSNAKMDKLEKLFGD